MTQQKKESELQIKTSLKNFSGFLKALALIGLMLGGSTGVSYFTRDKLSDDSIKAYHTQDSIIKLLQADMRVHDLRLSQVEATNTEVKATLVDIQKDIKTLLYISGKNEGTRK